MISGKVNMGWMISESNGTKITVIKMFSAKIDWDEI